MTQILLVDADENLRTIIKLNLMATLGVAVVEKESAKEAIALLEVLPSIDVIFSREKIDGESTSQDLGNYLSSINSSVPLVILGNNETKYANASAIKEASSWRVIIETVGKILGTAPDWQENRLISDYISVPVTYFLNINNTGLGCDVYIRVKKAEGDYQYIKRLHSYDYFSRSDIEKYVSTGLKEFYISKGHFSSFVNYVTNQLVEKLQQSVGGVERIVLTAESYEVTVDRIHSLGIDEGTVAVVQASIKSIQASIKEGNAFSDFIKLLQSNQLSYLYAHSYLACLLLHKIVERFEWNSSNIKDKLTYLAYFHDMSLTDDQLMKINQYDAYHMYLFKSDAEREKVQKHALLSSQLIDRFPEVPLGVATFIKEHHGAKNGIGFPKNLNLSIAPLSMMFVVVEHFVDEFLKIKEPPSYEQFENIFEKMRKRYTKGTYVQTLNALENLIVKKA